MKSRAKRRPATPSELHRQWLQLVDTEGPFLAVPPVKRVWPQGIPPLQDDRRAALAAAKPAFDAAWDAWDSGRQRDAEQAAVNYRQDRDSWVRVVLGDVLGWADSLHYAVEASAMLASNTVFTRIGEPVTPTAVLAHHDVVGALVLVVDPTDDLRAATLDEGQTSPLDRMEQLLRAPGSTTSIGVVTDGRWWAVVSAPVEGATASGLFDAQTFVEEPDSRNGFAAILSRRHLVSGEENDRLPALFAASVLAADELTEALGVQVRRAVELVVSAFGESARDAREHAAPDVLPDDPGEVYQAVVTVLMRVVFLLFAQERGLLPGADLFTTGYGLAGVLDDLEDRARDEGEEAMDATALSWHRLLATSTALYHGTTFEDLRLPSYRGSLFDPARFPFLADTTGRGTLRLTVSDRVMLHVLRAVQTVAGRGDRVSFRDVDVEQIGYIYEGLLGYTCVWAPEVTIGLPGSAGQEPEIGLDRLDTLAEEQVTDAKIAAAIRSWVADDQPGSKPPTAAALAKALAVGDTEEDAGRALLAVTKDAVLRERLRPWLGAIRRDLRDRPVVVLPGEPLLVETPSRRSAGAHYTPRTLAEEVVSHALEPLVYAPGPHTEPDPSKWVPISANEILRLRVADIACGSGAFLVAAARYLAGHLVAAWRRRGRTEPDAALKTMALREVVAHCLYGADINAMAVEMCKLSLWLVSLDNGLPFSFVDDKVLHGNALLGLTSLKQLGAMHIDPDADLQGALFGIVDERPTILTDLSEVVRRVREIRSELSSDVNNDDPQRSTDAKERLLAEINDLLGPLLPVADGVIAAGLRLGGKPGKNLNGAYENLRVAVGRAYPADNSEPPDSDMLDAIVAAGLTPTVPTDYHCWQPLHWALVVPDVLERGGFDAIIGNPPFLGGQKLTGAMGTNVRDWLVNVIADGARGSADLFAYFLLRVFSLLTAKGNLGLIATNTVAQGDTREVGLDRITEQGLAITQSIQSRPWPAASANLEYAAVWGTRGPVADAVPRIADGVVCRHISTLLEPSGRVNGKPIRLRENGGVAFQGCIVLGKGFVLDSEEAQRWIAEDPGNAEVLFPYLNGEDLNSRPDCSPSRWVIDFTGWCEKCAARQLAPFDRLNTAVKAERRRKPKAVRSAPWWQFLRTRPALRKATAGLDEVLVIAQVSKTVMPMRVVGGRVFDQKLVVFALTSYSDESVLSSSLHQIWAIRNSSTMRQDVSYAPSDAFLTFPRPERSETLDAIGKTLNSERREIMLRRELGLTKLYNLVNDPGLANAADTDVARMREIHVALDETVMAAYGWDDVPLDHGFHTYRQMTRWTVSPAARVEILDRLLEENHRRAAVQGDAVPVDDEASGDGPAESGDE